MFYIIFGDDNYRCHEALVKIKEELGNPDIISVNTTVLDGRKLTSKELSEVCDVVPFMSATRLVIVEGLLKRFQGGDRQSRLKGNGNGHDDILKDWQAMADYIKTMPQTTTLVLFEPDLDVRASNPMLKVLLPAADKSLELNEIKGRDLAEWIRSYAAQHGGKITAPAVSLLVNYIGGDLWLMAGEVDKLITYCSGREITENDVKEITSYAREDNIFDLVDSVLEGRIREAQHMLHRMLKYGTAPQQILAMIERQLMIILRVKDIGPGMSVQDIKEHLGLQPRYPLDKTMKQAGGFTIARLRRAFHSLLDTDVAIKTGKYENELALDLMVIELCKR